MELTRYFMKDLILYSLTDQINCMTLYLLQVGANYDN